MDEDFRVDAGIEPGNEREVEPVAGGFSGICELPGEDCSGLPGGRRADLGHKRGERALVCAAYL